ncbi:protein Tho1p [Trichomonascus vanleenenianus]|uniref:Tho1p n=1 Tax=Trichomonascus vanleenenianus TaxID=2268995 RepID=UPI003ECA360D
MAEYTSLKVAELKEILKQRGLALSGTKAELVERLKQADAEAEKETEAEEQLPEETVQPDTSAVETENQPEEKQQESAEAPVTEQKAEPAEDNEEASGEGAVTEEEKQRVIDELNKRIARGRRFGDEDSIKETEGMLNRVTKFGLERSQVNKILQIKSAKVTKQDRPHKAPIDDEEKLRRRRERFAA